MKLISEYIPTFTIVAIILGCINIFAYYLFFDIDILPFLEPTEVIFSFASISFELILLICFTAIMVGLMVLFDPDTLTDSPKPTGNQMHFFYKIVGLVGVLCSMIGTIFLAFNLTKIDFTRMSVVFCGIVILPTLLAEIFLISKLKFLADRKRSVISSLALFLMAVYIFTSNAAKEHHFGKSNPDYNYLLMLDGDKELRTNNTFKYVGNTNNYYFFKNINSEGITIIPIFEIKEVRRFLNVKSEETQKSK